MRRNPKLCILSSSSFSVWRPWTHFAWISQVRTLGRSSNLMATHRWKLKFSKESLVRLMANLENFRIQTLESFEPWKIAVWDCPQLETDKETFKRDNGSWSTWSKRLQKHWATGCDVFTMMSTEHCSSFAFFDPLPYRLWFRIWTEWFRVPDQDEFHLRKWTD